MLGNLGIAELILIFFFILPIILWIVALIDIVKSNFDGNNKLTWVIIVVFLPVLGALLYLLVGRNQKIKVI